MTPLVKEFVSLDTDVAIRYTWFDVGIVAKYTFQWTDLIHLRMPFDKCAICGIDGGGDKFLVLADREDEKIILLSAWVLFDDRYLKVPMFAIVMSNEGCQIAKIEGEKELTAKQATPIVGSFAAFMQLANPVGYKATVNRSSVKNKMRALKGRPPLVYDWKTVIIEPPAPKTEYQGGAHASPRLHDRRGHWRTCVSGKRVWVKDCKVGDASRGTVFKDYTVHE